LYYCFCICVFCQFPVGADNLSGRGNDACVYGTPAVIVESTLLTTFATIFSVSDAPIFAMPIPLAIALTRLETSLPTSTPALDQPLTPAVCFVNSYNKSGRHYPLLLSNDLL